MPDEPPVLRCADRAAWREWLAAHHAQAGSVWLVIPRKGQGGLTLDASVDEALCFGWIDSRPRRLDATASLLLMSPRRPGSAWSGVITVRIARLRQAGLMASSGEAAIARAEVDGSWSLLGDASALREPPELLAALAEQPDAAAAWRGFPPSHRRANLERVTQAKRPATGPPASLRSRPARRWASAPTAGSRLVEPLAGASRLSDSWPMSDPSTPTGPTGPTGPLKGLRVLDLTRVLAGPTCTQMLGDLGAEIIKIERPEAGDDTRGFAPPFVPNTKESAYFVGVNRNKKSLTLDIAKPEAQALVLRLLEGCDMLVENFKVGALAKYGLGYEQLAARYPRLIYCSITGFGQTGPYAPRPGYDALIQAMGGVMSLTGEPNGSPQKVGIPVADLFAGLYGCIGILAALRHRDATGQGQQIDIGMLDTHVAWLANQGMNYLATGENPPRLGNQHPNISPYQEYPTKDGYLILAVGNDPTFAKFCNANGLAHMLADERFATNPARVANRDLVTATLTPVMRGKTTAEWVAALEALGVGCGPINTLEQVFADPHVIAREMVVEMAHATGETVKVIANPVKLSATPADYRSAPPTLGEHSDHVLRDILGLSEAEIAGLRERGIT